jgi:hypothetical protein
MIARKGEGRVHLIEPGTSGVFEEPANTLTIRVARAGASSVRRRSNAQRVPPVSFSRHGEIFRSERARRGGRSLSCLGNQMILRPQGILAELFSERFCERERVDRPRRQDLCQRERERATSRERKKLSSTEEIAILHFSIPAIVSGCLWRSALIR